jgi:hypothetical protein
MVCVSTGRPAGALLTSWNKFYQQVAPPELNKGEFYILGSTALAMSPEGDAALTLSLAPSHHIIFFFGN